MLSGDMARDTLIIPSILAADYARLGEEIRATTEAGADRFHLDVMDGHVVKNLSFGPDVIRAIRPYTTLPFEVHLMVQPARDWIAALKMAGADRILLPLGIDPDMRGLLSAVADLGMKAGLVLAPDDPATSILPHLAEIDVINVLAVTPGFGGQKFLDKILSKVTEIRNMIGEREIDLFVDGGVNLHTVARAAKAGANGFVAGTGIFSHGPTGYAKIISAMREEAQSNRSPETKR